MVYTRGSVEEKQVELPSKTFPDHSYIAGGLLVSWHCWDEKRQSREINPLFRPPWGRHRTKGAESSRKRLAMETYFGFVLSTHLSCCFSSWFFLQWKMYIELVSQEVPLVFFFDRFTFYGVVSLNLSLLSKCLVDSDEDDDALSHPHASFELQSRLCKYVCFDSMRSWSSVRTIPCMSSQNNIVLSGSYS